MDRVAAIRARLSQQLAPQRIDIVDESHLHRGHPGAAAGGGHFKLTIVAECFADQSMLQRHRMIYAALEDLMPTEIHALSIQALTTAEART